MEKMQKAGGIAAVVDAAVYVIGIVLGVTIIFPVMGNDPSQYVVFAASNPMHRSSNETNRGIYSKK